MTQSLHTAAQRLAALLGSALILQFFSEYYFLNEGPAETLATGWAAWDEFAISTGFYMLFTAVFVIALERFEVKTLSGLLLAGSLFGWATEALAVPVVYESPPFSFAWPSVSWHGLIDVMLGWYALRLAMRRLAWPWLLLLFTGLGALWGYWASWGWDFTTTPPTATTPSDFWLIALVSGASWIVGTGLADWGGRGETRATRWEIGVVGLTALILFVGQGLPFLPWPAVLAALVAITIAALACGRARAPDRDTCLKALAPMPTRAAYVTMPALPLVAGGTYDLVYAQRLAVPTEDIVLLLFAVGTAWFVWALGVHFLAAFRKGSRES